MKFKSLNFRLFFLLLCLSIHAVESAESDPGIAGDEPWFTGPLLTPSPRVVKIGHVNLEPYLYYTIVNGVYDDNWDAHSLPNFYQFRPQLVFKIGLSETVDLTGAIQSVASWTQGKSSSSFGDMPLGFDIRIYEGDEKDVISYAKFTVQEIFPTGRYQNLRPSRLGTDAGGQGAYYTSFGFTFSKLAKFSSGRFLEWRTNISAAFAPRVHVRGLNVYGGAPGTKGTVSLGPTYLLLTAIEYTMTKRWTFACDFQASYFGRERFKGRTAAPVGSAPSAQFSIAPAIEYNWDECCGIIVGTWFSLAGRNSPRFYNIVAAYNYYF